jgi:polar amino acid transport system substrate-binding protein
MRLPALLLVCLLGVFAQAREIKVAVGLSLPPYVLQKTNSGMELDVVNQALAAAGHTIKPVYLPFARVPVAMQEGEVDAAITVNESSGIKASYSDSHITYQNFAITLTKSNLKIGSIDDLAKHSVAAFQNAKLYLGDKFAAMANANKAYSEHAEQVKQNKMLYTGRVDVVVGDRNIFKYFNNDAKQEGVNVSEPVSYHEIFPPTPYKVAFRDAALRDAFNAALKKMHGDGRYDAIMKKYQ